MFLLEKSSFKVISLLGSLVCFFCYECSETFFICNQIGLIYECGQDRRDSFDDNSEECGNNYIQDQSRGCKSPQVQQLSYFHWLIVEVTMYLCESKIRALKDPLGKGNQEIKPSLLMLCCSDKNSPGQEEAINHTLTCVDI